jgi:hypothetical protein
MAGKFSPVQRHPIDMTPGEVRALFGDMADSQVIRTILMAEIEDIRRGAKRERRTMRNVWYDVVKPVLSRAGILNKATSGGKPVDWARKLSKYLTEIVRDGLTTYEELSIIDGSRQRQVAQNVTDPVASVLLVGAHYPWVILFTEKDTVWGEVESLATLYGVSAISGGGQPSNACTENTVRAIIRSKAYQAAQPEKMVLLCLTDYDPFGYSIADSQFDQVTEAAQGMSTRERGRLSQVTVKRLGLYPWQLTAGERQMKAYEPKDVGLEAWLAETGGVDGLPLGLELDALELSRLRQLFAQGIEQHVDMEKRRQDLRDALLDRLAYELLLPEMEQKRRAMRAAVEGSALWRDLLEMPIPEDLFMRCAVSGAECIDPVQDTGLFAPYCEDIRQTMARVI